MRNDASLANVHKDPKFKTMMDKFDEPLFNVGWRRTAHTRDVPVHIRPRHIALAVSRVS